MNTLLSIHALRPSVRLSPQINPYMQEGNTEALRHPSVEAPPDVLLRLVQLAVSCTQMPTSRRPTMAEVVSSLEGIRRELYGVVVARNIQWVDEHLSDLHTDPEAREISLTAELRQIL